MSLSLTLAIESLLAPMFISAIILTMLALARLLFQSSSRIEVIAGTGAILISTIGLLIHGISDYYTGVGFNEAAIFHLKHGLSGLGWAVAWPILAVLFLTAIMMVALFEIGRRKRLARGNGEHAAVQGIGKVMATVYLIMLAINPALMQSAVMASHAANWAEYSAEMAERTVNINIDLVATSENPRSFVYLYAESFEAAFVDDKKWPGLAPNMKKMEEDPHTLSLRNVKQAPATGWTVAGMAASQCGFPAIADEFYATTPADQGGRTCLGDLLSHAGYTTSYMGGAHLAFAGKGDFYRIHGFDRVRGGPELMKEYSDRALKNSEWGLYDDDLFSMALEEFDRLTGQNKPFGLFMLTLDTHPHDGYENEHCKKMGRYTDDAKFGMLDAVHCSDQLIKEFIQAIRSRPGGQDVIIIVGSDHLQSTNSSTRKQLGYEHERRNLWMAQGPGIKGLKVEREASMFDIAPTMAQLLGMDVPAMGLGRSLMEKQPTLVEEMGVADLYARLRSVFGGMGQSRDKIDGDEILKQFGIKTDSSTGPGNSQAPAITAPNRMAQ